MKTALGYLLVELIISLVVALLLNGGFTPEYLTAVGLMNLILGILGLIIGVITLAMKEMNIGRAILISSGLLLLIGVSICAAFPIQFNGV